jgi:hypothetical protein
MTYLQLRTRTQYLRGEEDVAGDTVINSHIQYAILDILNKFPFSWSKVVLTTQSTNTNLPSTYNPKWGISVNDTEGEWTQIFPEQSFLYKDGDHVYWITYESSAYKLNAPSTETVTITYHTIPTALSGDSDVCIIPDGEAVAYLAAAKMYIGDERNAELKADYLKESTDRVTSLIQADSLYGPDLTQGSILDYNNQITGF